MSGETEQAVSGWTVDTLKEHFERQHHDLIVHLDERYERQQKAIDDRAESTDERFRGVNEFRGQLADQAALLMPRAEADARFTAMEDKLAAMSSRLDRAEGSDAGSAHQRTNQRLDTGQLVASFAALIGLLSLVAAIIIATR